MPFTSLLSVTVGHECIRFQGEGHRLIADRRLHMFTIHTYIKSRLIYVSLSFWRQIQMTLTGRGTRIVTPLLQ